MKKITMTVSMTLASILTIHAQSTPCRATITADTQAVVADLSAIASQAGAQGFPEAMRNLATDLETILPSLNQPDQALVEKFVTDLEAAISSTGPGGPQITTAEKIQLSNDIVQLLTSTGMTSTQVNRILDDLSAVADSVSGISTSQLQADLRRLAADTNSCRIN
jgi:hypothetical protein